MKRLMTGMIVLLLLTCFIATEANATGLGIFFPFGQGTADYDLFETDSYNFGIGFVLDGTVARNRLFNYRLNVGLETFSHEYEDSYYNSYYNDYNYWTEEISGIRIVTDHTFGFGLLRTRIVRLWLGPSVRIGFVAGESNTTDAAGITLGAGFTALGLNFNFGRVFTLGFEAGYRFIADLYFDDIYYYEYSSYYSYYYQSSDAALSHEFIAKLSIIFRIRDVFERKY